VSNIGIKHIWKNTKSAGLIVREIIGWLLLVVGLNVFRTCFGYLDTRQVIEAFVAFLIGLFIFRGGLQLVKVAVAARAFVRDESPQSG